MVLEFSADGPPAGGGERVEERSIEANSDGKSYPSTFPESPAASGARESILQDRHPVRLSPEQRRHDALAGQWQIAQPRPQRVGHGVADRSDGRPAASLADAEAGAIGAGVDQLDRDLRHLAEAQYRVVLPVARADAGAVEAHPFLQCPARRVDDAAFELVDRAVRIDHEPGIRSTPRAVEADALLDLDLGDDRGIGGHVFVPGEGDPTTPAGA